MDAFSPRPNAHLDYWFWKFHVGDLAFLVDLIVRRQTGLAEVRVSQWLRGVGRVVHDETSDWSTSPAEVRIGRTTSSRAAAQVPRTTSPGIWRGVKARFSRRCAD